MRTTFISECDNRGNPDYGVICFHEFTMMTGSIKPYNFDITFAPDKVELCHESYRRIRKMIPKALNPTAREREILACLDKGMNSKEMGHFLFISKATVDTHRQNMLRKYNMPNTSALLRLAKEQGWL
jgi:DNA-binding CsgD family transcriptional regulator